MRKIIISFLMLTSFLSFGQQKRSTYLDSNMNTINRDSFHSINKSQKYLSLSYDTDTTYLNVLFKRKINNRLKSETFSNLKQYLQNISNQKIEKNSIILINYLSKNPKIKDTINTSQWNIFHENFMKRLKKKNNLFQVWVNHPEQLNLIYYQSEKINWLEDKTRFIENLFFPYDFLYGSFVVINFDGSYISYYGEYGKNTVIELLDEIKE